MGDLVPEIIQTMSHIIMHSSSHCHRKSIVHFKIQYPYFSTPAWNSLIENGPVLDLQICRELSETQLRASPLLLQTGTSLRIGTGDGLASG